MENLIIPIVLLTLGYFIGSAREEKHFKSLRKREAFLNSVPCRSTGKKEKFDNYSEGSLVSGHVVVGQDYFKSFLAGLVSIVGGRMTTYEALLDRGRREALCRMREQASKWGCKEIVNVRYETSVIGQNQGKQKSGAIEVFAYGTALK